MRSEINQSFKIQFLSDNKTCDFLGSSNEIFKKWIQFDVTKDMTVENRC